MQDIQSVGSMLLQCCIQILPDVFWRSIVPYAYCYLLLIFKYLFALSYGSIQTEKYSGSSPYSLDEPNLFFGIVFLFLHEYHHLYTKVIIYIFIKYEYNIMGW